MAPPNVIETGVLEGRFDLGLAPHHRLSNALSYLDLYAEEMILYCGRGHPLFESGGQKVEIENLRRFAYAGFDFNSPNMVVGQRLGLKRTAHARDEQALTILIKSGRYIGFLPSHMAQPFVAKGHLKEVLREQTRYRSVTAAITRKTPEANRKLTEFLKCLSDAHPPELKGAT